MNFEIDLSQIRPYYDALGDGLMQLSFTLPLEAGPAAEKVAREMLRRMNLSDISIVEQRRIAPQFVFFVVYAKTNFSVDATAFPTDSQGEEDWEYHRINQVAEVSLDQPLVVVGATLESDAHTVGLDAIFNLKGFAGHYGLERYPCFKTFNLGAQVPFARLIEVIRRENADAVLISQTVTQKGLHLKNLSRLVDLLEAESLRTGLILIAGGPQMTPELAQELGYDAGFGRGTLPERVAGFIVKEFLRRANA